MNFAIPKYLRAVKIPNGNQQAGSCVVFGLDPHKIQPDPADLNVWMRVSAVIADGLDAALLDHKHPLKDGRYFFKSA